MASQHMYIHRISDKLVQSERDGASVHAPLFPYWSFTKTVIAICVLQVMEQGKLDLDDKFSDWPFTWRQLLNHTSGLPDYGALPAYQQAVAEYETPWDRERLLAQTLSKGVRFGPGEGWAYSNVGYMFLREGLEAVAGLPFDTLVQQRITVPLNLKSVTLANSRQHFSKLHWSSARHYHPGWVYHGCLIGTAADAATLLHGLFAGQLLSRNSLAQMMTVKQLGGGLVGRPWSEHGYGLGLMAGRLGAAGRAFGHSGAGPFCVNAVYHLPDLPSPETRASFTTGTDEGVAEWALTEAGSA